MRAVTVLSLLTGAQAQQVLNGNFESDVVDAYSYMTPTGWTASGGVVVSWAEPSWRSVASPAARPCR